MSRARLLTLALACAATPALALEVEGRYRASPEADCEAGDGAEGFLRIEDGVFHGLSGTCKMRNPVNVRDMNAQLFDMECEGANPNFQWTERALFMEGAEGGLILAWNGYAFRYERCPVPTPETAEAEPEAAATEAATD
ncbi:hypothetical protein FHY55_20280 [Oceanicola sp. D3]|uniref:hypothetical protein n=1 Tax=Oceanicola sp. D3 TaxID=2587163 RepID=UPI001122FCE0|nr:hypothetical protein [Oceanicola sp. D3]QDC11423.1 hypothetical protein FHY55_20280 [Oceanicola sp. D3]